MRNQKSITFLAALTVLLAFMPEWMMAAGTVHDYLYPQPSLELHIVAGPVVALIAIAIILSWTTIFLVDAYGLSRRRRWGWWLNMILSVGMGLFVLVVGGTCDLDGQDTYIVVFYGVPCGVALIHLIVTHSSLWWPGVRAEFH